MSMGVVVIVYFSDREDIPEKMTHKLMDRGWAEGNPLKIHYKGFMGKSNSMIKIPDS